MAIIVVATVGCSNLHLTEVRMISPVLAAGQVGGMFGSSADFCDECDEPAVVMDLAAREVPDDFPDLDLYRLRH